MYPARRRHHQLLAVPAYARPCSCRKARIWIPFAAVRVPHHGRPHMPRVQADPGIRRDHAGYTGCLHARHDAALHNPAHSCRAVHPHTPYMGCQTARHTCKSVQVVMPVRARGCRRQRMMECWQHLGIGGDCRRCMRIAVCMSGAGCRQFWIGGVFNAALRPSGLVLRLFLIRGMIRESLIQGLVWEGCRKVIPGLVFEPGEWCSGIVFWSGGLDPG